MRRLFFIIPLLVLIFTVVFISGCVQIESIIIPEPIVWESMNGPPGGRIQTLLQNPYNHNELYTLVGGYESGRRVYRSEDKGKNWEIINESKNMQLNSIALFQDKLFMCGNNGVYYYDSNEGLVKISDTWCAEATVNDNKLFIIYYVQNIKDVRIFYTDLTSDRFDWKEISFSEPELKDLVLPPKGIGFGYGVGVQNIVALGNRILANVIVNVQGSGQFSNSQLYISENFGETWNRVELGKQDDVIISNIIQDPNNRNHILLTLKHNIMHEFKSPVSQLIKESFDGGQTWKPLTNADTESNGVINVAIAGSTYYLLNPYDSYMLKLNESGYERIEMPRVKEFEEIMFNLDKLLFDFDYPSIVYGQGGSNWAMGLVKSEDGMKTWKKMDSDIVASSRTIVLTHPTNPDIVFTSGNVIQESYLTKDAGKTWEPFTPINTGDEVRVDPHNPNHIIFITEATALYESYDMGKTFKRIGQDFSSAKIFDFEIAKDNPEKIYVSNIGLGISEYLGNGEWRYIIGSPDYVYDFEIDPEDSNNLYAANSPKIFEDHSSVWRYSKKQEENFGWSELFRFENFRGITSLKFDPKNPNKLYAGVIGKDGTIYVSNDKGEIWNKLNEDLTFTTIWGHSQLQIDPNDKNTVYAGTWGGGTYKTTNAGRDWALLDNKHTFSPTCLAVYKKNPNIIYACDRTAPKIHKSVDAGKTWTEYYDFGSSYMLTSAVAIDPDNPDTIYAAAFMPPMAHAGELAKIENGTATEIGKDLPRSVIEIELDPKNKNTIYATTHIHGLYKSDDGGITWEKLDDKNNGLPRIGIYDIDVDPENSEILYATALCGVLPDYMMPPQAIQLLTGFKNLDPDGKCGVYKSVDAGNNWELILPTISEARGIDIDPKNPSNLYVADMMGGVWVSNDAGQNWRQENSGLGSISMTSVKIKDNYIYASTQGSGVYSGIINSNGSITWDRTRSNKPKAFVYKLQIAVDPNNSDRIYASSYPGGLLRSDDGGKNWNDKNFLTPSIKVEDPTVQGYYFFDIDTNNTKNIWLGAYGKGMFVSHDGMDFDMFANGVDNIMADKHVTSLKINPSNPDEIYVGTQEGVFVTQDSGKHWKEMNDGLQTLDIRSLRIADIEYPPFEDNFEDGNFDGWSSQSVVQNAGGWSVVQENGNYVLQGIDHTNVVAGSELWSDYTFESRVKLIEGGIHVNYRMSGSVRYAVGLRENGMYLMKSTGPNTHINLVNIGLPLGKDWNTIKIVGKGGNIKVYVNNALKINYTDDEPVLNGGINFESLPDSKVYVDDIRVTLDKKSDTVVYAGTAGYGLYQLATSAKKWQNLGRTLGSGWWSPWERRMYQFSSILFDPDVSGKVYYGHFPGGFFISEDNGKTWKDSSLGLGNDGMFSLSMHPNNHNILFAGTYNGVAKSVDKGRTWTLKSNGMPSEQWPYTVAIDSNNPSIMYASTKNGQNKGFCDRNVFCGVVMKSVDGGENWFKIMNGLDDRSEFYTLLIYPPDHNILFLSTNKVVYMSRDAGNSWKPINNGLPSTNNQVRDNVAENLALTPDGKYLILGLAEYGLWKADLSDFEKISKIEERSGKRLIAKSMLIDTHFHFCSRSNAIQIADRFVEEMDKANASKTVLFGCCDQPYFDKNLYVDGIRREADEKVLEAYERHPDRFYPMLSGFDPQNPNSVEYLDQQLATGIWKGLGEIYLIQFSMLDYKTIADHPNMMKIYRVLAKYNVPIFFHYERRAQEDVDAMYNAIEQNPDVKFVWVHLGSSGRPDEIENELARFPNLYLLWEVPISKGMKENKDFLNLLEKYSDRFMIGSDAGCTEDFSAPTDCPEPPNCLTSPYEDAITAHRELLSKLSPETAKKIAYKNIEDLMGESPEGQLQMHNQNISGEIKQSQIWSGNIYVTGDTWAVPEATITILPGTNVYIAAGRDDQNSGGAGDAAEFGDPIETEEYSKTHIDIYARIVAKGLPNQKILFTSDAPEKTFADWACIGLREGSTIDNAIVEYGGNCGLDSTVCGKCKNVTISNSTIRHVLWGCVTLGGSSATVINNEIYDCGHEGVDTQSGGGMPVIKNNVIKYSANGLMLNENSFPLVENNTIVDNAIGINAWGCGGKITNNYISSPNGPPNDWVYKNYVYRRDAPRAHTNSCPNPDPNLGCPETEPRTGIITIPATTAEFVNNTIENVEEEIRMEG